jgi:GAF domain-containing protein
MLADNVGGHQINGRRFHILMQSLREAESVHDVLSRVALTTAEVIPEADVVGVTMRRPDGGCDFPVDVGDDALTLDRIQCESGRGPCVEVTEPGGPAAVLCPDLTSRVADRWPALAAAAVEHGYSAMVAAGVPARGSDGAPVTGAISAYARKRGTLTEPARDTAVLLATHASLAIAAVQAGEATRHEVANLRAALHTRDVIGQAKGVLMERYGLTARHAFDALSAASQHLNVKLAELAAVIADGHRRPVAGAAPAVRRQRVEAVRERSLDRTIESFLSSAAVRERLAGRLERQAAEEPASRLVHLAQAAYQRGLAAGDRAKAAALARSAET